MKKKFDFSKLLTPLILLIVLSLTIMFIPQYVIYILPLILIYFLYTRRYIVYAFQDPFPPYKQYNFRELV